jgi:hypothetical protein
MENTLRRSNETRKEPNSSKETYYKGFIVMIFHIVKSM